jgi:hypothetical protein
MRGVAGPVVGAEGTLTKECVDLYGQVRETASPLGDWPFPQSVLNLTSTSCGTTYGI